ncbi:MAG: hypothetical protein CVV04_10070 [Firmicutes bacterium HGW-Firmicutes-9]|jgi:uncharacterized membrane protein YraQ (UPF0718 family)|nr:MAG: hypothetical protein CVV04_10070 [Firmicutes bacterium HGW-Firmicutes-9]
MASILSLLKDTGLYLLQTLSHNGLVLLLGILIAGALRVYIDTERMKQWLMGRAALSIPATVAFGAFTPFCACGTMAVVLGMLASSLPWGAIMAFLTSSPLMSPDEFVLISGILGMRFAVALTAASVLIGLGAGYLANILQKRTSLFQDQLRFAATPKKSRTRSGTVKREDLRAASYVSAAACCTPTPATACCTPTPAASCCNASAGASCCVAAQPARAVSFTDFLRRIKLDALAETVFDLGIRKILPLFLLFAAVGYLINRFIPAAWISAVFGAQNAFAVPIAALVGLPLYVSGSAAIPLLDSLQQAGVSSGAMLAFMITGPGTSAGVIAGISSILKPRAIAFYLACLMVGAIVLGYLFDAVLLLL